MKSDGFILEEEKLFAGRYLVKRLLGSGGMGKVYLVEDTILGNESITLKILHPHFSEDEKHTKRFLREVQLTRKVTHPNVVRTFDVGTHEQRLFFTMEYVEGVTLKEKLGPEKTDPLEAARILIEISKGLSAIHAAGIIHRDLKPGNVILNNLGIPKITDFGVARPGMSDLTGHDEIIGSIPYMAPEIWLGREIGITADFYALGMLAYELLTELLPFSAETPAEMMCKHLETNPIPPSELVENVPAWLDSLVLCMLAKEPSQRPQSAEEIVAVLEYGIQRQANENSGGASADVDWNAHDEGNLASDDTNSLECLNSETGPEGNIGFLFPNDYVLPGDPSPLVNSSNVSSSSSIVLGPRSDHVGDVNISISQRVVSKLLQFGVLSLLAAFVVALCVGPLGSTTKSLLQSSLGAKGGPPFFSFGVLILSFSLLFSLPILFIAALRLSLRECLEIWLEMVVAKTILILLLFGYGAAYNNYVKMQGLTQKVEGTSSILASAVANISQAALLIPSVGGYNVAPDLNSSKISRDLLSVIRGMVPYFLVFGCYVCVLLYLIKREILALRGTLIGFLSGFGVLFFGLFYISDYFLAPLIYSAIAEKLPEAVTLHAGALNFTVSTPALLSGMLNWLFLGIGVALLARIAAYRDNEQLL